jgi:hypothetical protein
LSPHLEVAERFAGLGLAVGDAAVVLEAISHSSRQRRRGSMMPHRSKDVLTRTLKESEFLWLSQGCVKTACKRCSHGLREFF